MRFLLDKKVLNRGCIEHKNAGLGCAADYEAYYDKLFAPFKTTITKIYYGEEGGNWIWFNDSKGNSIQCAHLDKYLVKQGQVVEEGQQIGVTGNTGKITTGAHLHVQIIDPKGNRIDPVPYFDSFTNQGKVMFDKAIQYNRDIAKGIIGEGGREPSVLRLVVKYDTKNLLGKIVGVNERALLRKFPDGSVKIKRNVGMEEFVMNGAGEPVPVKLEDVSSIPGF